jgi:protein SCO1/2
MAILLLLAVACRPSPSPVPEVLEENISPGVEHPETAGFRVVEREEKDPPVPASNFTLIDQTGEPVSLDDFKGQVVMMSFLYTNCPEACPLVAANFVNVQRQVSEGPKAENLIQILVSTDPENDTPNRLRAYTRGIGGQWFFLNGDLEDVAKVWEAYNIYREVQERNREIVVYHSYRTFLIDQDGQIRFEHVGVWFPDDILPDVQLLLDET